MARVFPLKGPPCAAAWALRCFQREIETVPEKCKTENGHNQPVGLRVSLRGAQGKRGWGPRPSRPEGGAPRMMAQQGSASLAPPRGGGALVHSLRGEASSGLAHGVNRTGIKCYTFGFIQ